MRKYDAVIFDCDGTLVDTEHLAAQAVAEYSARHGISLTAEQAVNRFRGLKMADCLSQLEVLHGTPLPACFDNELRCHMERTFTQRLQPIEGAIEVVRSLSVPMAVASNGPRSTIELSLGICGLLPYFNGQIFSAYDIASWKPDPGLFLHAARSLGAPPARCAVIEDSLPGIEAGRAAGMKVFAVGGGLVSSQIPADVHMVEDLRELIPLLCE